MIRDLVHDTRFGLRSLYKRPGFALLAILTIALGIGAKMIARISKVLCQKIVANCESCHVCSA